MGYDPLLATRKGYPDPLKTLKARMDEAVDREVVKLRATIRTRIAEMGITDDEFREMLKAKAELMAKRARGEEAHNACNMNRRQFRKSGISQ